MFRRNKGKKAKGPVANELRGASEPNELSNWTVDDAADVEPEEEDFEVGDEDETEDQVEEADDRTPAQRRADLEAELQRQAEEFGLTGDNPVGLYGPNGEDVAGLIAALPTIDYDTAEAIADAYEAGSAAERKIARSVIGRTYRNGSLAYELDAAERAVADWRSSLMIGDDDADLFGIVAAAATDAVDALVLEDELDVDDEEGEGEEEADTDDTGAGETETATSDETEDEAEEGVFGPNSALVVEFLNKLSELETVDLSELVAAWREQPKDELRIAHRALQQMADEDAKWREQLRLAQEEVFAWMDHRPTAFFDHYVAASDSRSREIAGPAVADAVAALAMADILEPEDAATLYAPWVEVVGVPALPTYEEDDEEGGEEPEDKGKKKK